MSTPLHLPSVSAPQSPCPHPGTPVRRFGGALLCPDCSKVVGHWRTDTDTRTLAATQRPDGTLAVTPPGGAR